MNQKQHQQADENLHRADKKTYREHVRCIKSKKYHHARLITVERFLGANNRLLYSSKAVEVCYSFSDDYATISVMVFVRRKSKHLAYRNFKDFDTFSEWVEKVVMRFEDERKEEQQRKRETVRGLKMGDLLSASWGYDQTNINYYKVTKLIGQTMVEVVEIAAEKEETGFMCGQCVPVPNKHIGAPMRRKAEDGRVTISAGVIYASKIKPIAKIADKEIYGTDSYSYYA